MRFFEQITQLPPDPIFGLSAAFKADPRPNKHSFIVGYFCDENLQTPLLDSVVEIERRLAEEKHKREYLPIDGDPEYVEAIANLVFGKTEERICGAQTIGGTGALFLAGKLAKLWTDQIAISNITWANHWKIFTLAGLQTPKYPYYEKKELQFEKMVEHFSTLPENSCVLLHATCHNPTGFDLTKDQWKRLQEVTEKHHLFPIFDLAYQGFASNPEEDAYGPRLFLEKGGEFALTYSCAKNFSLYGERAGALFVVGESPQKIKALRTQLKAFIRASYSNPPVHAASIVKGILQDGVLQGKWLSELAAMRERVQKVRNEFVDLMVKKDPEGNWEPIRKGNGLFCYSELSKTAVETLREKHGFYIAGDGRINVTGISQENIEAFTDAIVSSK